MGRKNEELIRTHGVQSPTFAQAAFEAGIFRPAILYQDASPDIRDRLIGLLDCDSEEGTSGLNANNCLVALAMIGDDTVAEYFQKWEENSRPWRSSLYVGPLAYALEGGWYMEDGKRKPLFFEECYALEASEDAAPEENLYGGTAPRNVPTVVLNM